VWGLRRTRDAFLDQAFHHSRCQPNQGGNNIQCHTNRKAPASDGSHASSAATYSRSLKASSSVRSVLLLGLPSVVSLRPVLRLVLAPMPVLDPAPMPVLAPVLGPLLV